MCYKHRKNIPSKNLKNSAKNKRLKNLRFFDPKSLKLEWNCSKRYFKQITQVLIWPNSNNMKDTSCSRNCSTRTLYPNVYHPQSYCWGVCCELSRRIIEVCKRGTTKQHNIRGLFGFLVCMNSSSKYLSIFPLADVPG